MLRNIIWVKPFLIISLKHLGVFEKEFEVVLFEQCCEVQYPIPLTRKGIDPPTSKEAPGSQGSSPGGDWGLREGGGSKNIYIFFNMFS